MQHENAVDYFSQDQIKVVTHNMRTSFRALRVCSTSLSLLGQLVPCLFPPIVFGTAVVSHGYQPSGSSGSAQGFTK